MSQENIGTEMFEMRKDLDTVQSDIPEDMSELQDADLVQNEEIERPEETRFRVILFDSDDHTYQLDYFNDYSSAMDVVNSILNDDEFVTRMGKIFIVQLSEAHRGRGQIFWEVISQGTIYPSN